VGILRALSNRSTTYAHYVKFPAGVTCVVGYVIVCDSVWYHPLLAHAVVDVLVLNCGLWATGRISYIITVF
jgi:hypothetical protein